MMGGSTRRNVFELVSALRLKSRKRRRRKGGRRQLAAGRERQNKYHLLLTEARMNVHHIQLRTLKADPLQYLQFNPTRRTLIF